MLFSKITKIIAFGIGLSCLTIIACKLPNQENPTTTQGKQTSQYVKLTGSTMGTSYHITLKSTAPETIQAEIEKVLSEVNESVNTYIDNSLISIFNQSPKGINIKTEKTTNQEIIHKHFITNFQKAQEVYQASNGAFDPTVLPLVSYWGFARKKEKVDLIDQKAIDSLLAFVGMDKITLNQDGFLSKSHPNTSLDFSALAKGYGIDAICLMLDQKGIDDYFVEIGGEVRTKGKNPRNTPWIVGIATPDPKAELQDLYAQVKLSGIALASSGNYRNYYETEKGRYGHTINPKTGKPEISRLLSASIFAKDCMTADAYATTCMAMGLEKAVELISKIEGVEGYFIYDDNSKFAVQYTEGAKKYILGLSQNKN